MTIQCGDHQFRCVLKAKKRLIGVQAKEVLKRGVDAGQHLYVRAGGEKLISRSGQHKDIDVVVHARFQDGLVELPVHFVGVSVRRRIIQLDDSDAAVGTVIDQLFTDLLGRGLDRSRHEVLLCGVDCSPFFRVAFDRKVGSHEL